jgi:hypothetical protein
MSYAVVWSENGGPLFAGRLDLDERSLRLDGTADQSQQSRRHVWLEELADVRLERHASARLAGLPTLVLELRDGPRFRIASLAGAGSLQELAEQVSVARVAPATMEMSTA